MEAIVNLNGKPIARVEAQRMMEPTQFRLIYNVVKPGKYEILLRAIDFNGNTGETKIEFSLEAPPTETPPPAETTPAETITPTETLTIAKPTTTAETPAPPAAEKAEFPALAALLAFIILLALVAVLALRKRS